MKRIMFIAVTGAALALAGCMSILPDFSRDLPGIPLKAGAADPYLQNLSRRAQRFQDKSAQLELGIRYEEGRGVPVNWDLAEQFYAVAGTTMKMGSSWGPGAVFAPPMSPGMREARVRLKALRAKRKALGR